MTDSTSLSALENERIKDVKDWATVISGPKSQIPLFYEEVDALVSAVEARVRFDLVQGIHAAVGKINAVNGRDGDEFPETRREMLYEVVDELEALIVPALNRPTDVHLGGQA